LPRIDELALLGVKVVFVTSATPDQLAAYLEREQLACWPVTFVADPTLGAHRAAGLVRSRAARWNPKQIVQELSAMAHGYLPGRSRGDTAQLGGGLLVDNGRVLYRHAARTAGDLVDANDVVDAALARVVARSPTSGRV
jgi:hypothetical protein